MITSTLTFDTKTTSAEISPAHTSDALTSPKRSAIANQSSFSDVCNMLGLKVTNDILDEQQMFMHQQVKEGQCLYTMGQPLESLYIVHSGFMKLVQSDGAGSESILSFPMKGDLLGIDALYLRAYQSECVALSNCVVISVPYKALQQLMSRHQGLDLELLQLMSQHIVQQQHLFTTVNTLCSEARVARFLATLATKFGELGYSSREFALRMTRLEIGAHLGLTLETISRTLSLFKELGYIDVDQRNITINDIEALRTLKKAPSRLKQTKNTAVKNVDSKPQSLIHEKASWASALQSSVSKETETAA